MFELILMLGCLALIAVLIKAVSPPHGGGGGTDDFRDMTGNGL